MKKIIFLLIIISILSGHCFSQETDSAGNYDNIDNIDNINNIDNSAINNWELHNLHGFGKTLKHGSIAAGETILSNAVLMSANLIYGYEWAAPTASSIKMNVTKPLIWEIGDGHIVNNIGHPYQGAMYFSAGRANHFGYYQSAIFNVLGSLSWEILCEQQRAAYNDVIVTTTGAMAFGEILYRLYVEARLSGIPAPLAFLINPAAGFHSLVSGWKPQGGGGNIYSFHSYMGISYNNIRYDRDDLSESLFSFNGFSGDAAIKVIYGNPFETESFVPYRHFEFDVSFGMNPGKTNNIRFITDGYLFSYAPVYTEKNRLSHGLTLHMDFLSLGKWDIQDSTIDTYSSALDWTVKYQYLFTDNSYIYLKSHAGFTFFGASEYYTPLDPSSVHWDPSVPTTGRNAFKTYNYGINSKFYFGLKNEILGNIDVSIFYYLQMPYKGTSDFTEGRIHWVIADATYSRLITKHITLGVTNTYSMERGFFKKRFTGFPLDTSKWSNSVMLFAGWNK